LSVTNREAGVVLSVTAIAAGTVMDIVAAALLVVSVTEVAVITTAEAGTVAGAV
jgi:hypothetical protein